MSQRPPLPAGPPLVATSDRTRFQAKAARISRRQERVRLPAAAVIPIIGGLLVLVADTQALALIPLQGTLVGGYRLTADQASWTLSATAIATAASVPVMTRMGDRYGLRRMLLVSLGIVTFGQLLCSVAHSFTLLVVGRTVLGVSAASALIYSLIRENSKDSHGVNRAIGVLTSATGVGIATSFLFGGVILKLHGTVQTFFWIVTVLSALVWFLSFLFIQDSPLRAKSSVDWLGGALLGASVVLLILGAGLGSVDGWGSAGALGLFGAAVIGAALWGLWELRTRAPMIDVRLLSRRTVWPAVLIVGIVNALGVYNSLAVSGFVQTPAAAGYGMTATPLMAGVYLLPISIPIAFGGIVAAPLIRAVGQKRCLVAGTAVIVADQTWFAFHHSTVADIVVGTAVFGCAYAVTNTAALGVAMTNARRGEAGVLSSMTSTAITLGLAVGPAVFVAALTSGYTRIPGTDVSVPAAQNYQTALLYAGFMGVIVLLAALLTKIPTFSHTSSEDVFVLSGTESPPTA